MFSQILQSRLLAIPLTLITVSIATIATANPAKVFAPHLQQIQESLPTGLIMRLPSEIIIPKNSDLDENRLFVRWFASENPQKFNVSLFTCENSPSPCLFGSFSVEKNTSPSAKMELQRHLQTGDRITLKTDKTNLYGYLVESKSQNPVTRFSSVMWEQDQMIYTVSFPAIERQTLLFMAYYMARNTPIYHR
jgi:hypothetical protein